MFTLLAMALLPTVVFCIIGLKMKLYNQKIARHDVVEGIGSSAFLGVVAILLGIFIAGFIGFAAEHSYVETKSIPLVAIKDNQSVHGSFFLGTGSIDGELTYTYMAKIITPTGRTAYKAGSISADKVSIIETDNESPKLIYMKMIIKNPKIRPWAFAPSEYNRLKEIVVPVGSVIKDIYRVDLE